MKATTKYERKEPMPANRSNSVFGINLMLAPQFFAKRSTYNGTMESAQPICKEFSKYYKEQLAIRSQVFACMKKRGYNPLRSQKEWTCILKRCNEAATNAFIEKYGKIQPCSTIQKCKKADIAIEYAAKQAMAEMSRLAQLRLLGDFTNDQDLYFDLPLDQGEIIYIYRQRMHSKATAERAAYKIGKTSRPKQRAKAHKTSNTDLEEIAIIPKGATITEAAIHRLFAADVMPGEREWFLLTNEQIEILKNRTALQKAIEENQTNQTK